MFHAIFDIYSPLQSMLIFGTYSPYGFHLYQNKTAFYKEPSFKILHCEKELLFCEWKHMSPLHLATETLLFIIKELSST